MRSTICVYLKRNWFLDLPFVRRVLSVGGCGVCRFARQHEAGANSTIVTCAKLIATNWRKTPCDDVMCSNLLILQLTYLLLIRYELTLLFYVCRCRQGASRSHITNPDRLAHKSIGARRTDFIAADWINSSWKQYCNIRRIATFWEWWERIKRRSSYTTTVFLAKSIAFDVKRQK